MHIHNNLSASTSLDGWTCGHVIRVSFDTTDERCVPYTTAGPPCATHCITTITRTNDGGYTVKMPTFSPNSSTLLSRLQSHRHLRWHLNAHATVHSARAKKLACVPANVASTTSERVWLIDTVSPCAAESRLCLRCP